MPKGRRRAPRQRPRGRVVAIAVGVTLAVGAAVVAVAVGVGPGTTSTPAAAGTAPSAANVAPELGRGGGLTGAATSASALPPLAATPAPLPSSSTPAPVRVSIPSIGVDSALDALGLEPNGELQTPPNFPVAGWYDAGTRPGDPGPAIIAGHIDSYKGPAVFYDLHRLQPGDPVTVTRADGSVVSFTVSEKAQYPKSNFPTDAVYGPTPLPELKLITCTGAFDRTARSYDDNLVVTAVLAG